MTDENAITAARRRVQEAAEKFDRQQRRYALLTVESEASAKSEKAEATKALLAELEAELEAAQDALRALEQAETEG